MRFLRAERRYITEARQAYPVCGERSKMRDLDEILEKTIDRMRAVSDCEAVCGKPVTAQDGTVMIPVSKVSCGFVAGGGEYGLGQDKSASAEAYPCAAASGGGITVTPLGFLVCGREKRFISVSAAEKEEGWKDLLRAAVNAVKRSGGDE